MTEELLDAIKAMLHFLNSRPVHRENVIVEVAIEDDGGSRLGTITMDHGRADRYVFYPNA